jgi:hypothetical protein
MIKLKGLETGLILVKVNSILVFGASKPIMSSQPLDSSLSTVFLSNVFAPQYSILVGIHTVHYSAYFYDPGIGA